MPHAEIPFYCYNIPQEHWPATCPDFLLELSDKDRGIIGTRDEDYRRISWDEVKGLINSNKLERFGRVPSELRKYRKFVFDTIEQYGSMMNFVLNSRLGWESSIPKGAPFQHPDDITVLFNDWPYGIDTRIVHLVVWTKFDLKEDPLTGHVTPTARAEIEGWMQKNFYCRMKREHVAWFKNWTAIKSIHALEHFHVMLFDPDMAFVREITNGDVPQVAKVALY